MPIYKGTSGSVIKTIYVGDGDTCLLNVYKGTQQVFPGGYFWYVNRNKSTVFNPGAQYSTYQIPYGGNYDAPAYDTIAAADKTSGVIDGTWTLAGTNSYLRASKSSSTTVTVNVSFMAAGDTARNVYCYALGSTDGGTSWLARAMNTVNVNTSWTNHSYSTSTFTLAANELLVPFAFYTSTGGSGYWVSSDRVKHLVVQVT